MTEIIQIHLEVYGSLKEMNHLANVNTNDSSIFKYKSSILGKATTAFGNERLKSDSHFPKKIVLLS